ncbi:porin family protein [Aminobacter sp. SR38]|jgi:outer membrane immunogenic protein|uniref:outer membrane protein n=1 Tax=Aminobacter sp. SR38 TaxID=2774562 RepID=UPI00177DE090|nr:outer membrane protein [Aminobacter sp. SR38]QOF71834.1 porin family protein [Aminobacter sp. SR38]
MNLSSTLREGITLPLLAMLLSTSLVATGTTVHAGEQSAIDWSGVYVGAQIGYGWGDSKLSASNPNDTWEIDPGGANAGIYAGYNHQMSSGLVVGVETEINANGVKGDGRYLYRDEPWGSADNWPAEVDLKWSGSTRLRFGYAMDRWMPFVTGGVAYAGYDVKTYDFGSIWDEGDGMLVGWTIGAGAEYAVTDNIRIRGAYLFTDYGSDSFDSHRPSGDFYDTYEIDLKTHAASLGVSFNW